MNWFTKLGTAWMLSLGLWTAPPAAAICSPLDFSGLSFPADIPAHEQDDFTVALNLSSSYEGEQDWTSISNNFDGQGMSLGLLNQPFGQGELEVMLIEMGNQYPKQFQTPFSVKHLKSLSAMLVEWQKAPTATDYVPYFWPKDVFYSASGRNAIAVKWAEKNLYDKKGNFKEDWDREFQELAGTVEYRSIQIEHAGPLHTQAKDLMSAFGTSSLRSYLFFYDISVQNGGIDPLTVGELQKEFKKGTWTEIAKLKRILEVRLKLVRPKYKNDVKARKTAIIDSWGWVHHRLRNFPMEYCVDLNQDL